MTITHLIVPLDRFSLQSALRHYLLEALLHQRSGCLNFNQELYASEVDIPLCRLNTSASIIYRSAIALKLASHQSRQSSGGVQAQLIAQRLVEIVQSLKAKTEPLLFEIHIQPPGWLNFYLSDHSLAAWLQQLPQLTSIPQRQVPWLSSSTSLRGLQYVHARCCSLLRLGHEQGVIVLAPSNLEWRWFEPNPIPWFSANFQLIQPAERHLISQLLRVADAPYTNMTQTDSLILAKHLSRAILQFERYCRFFGDVQISQPILSQARLGLLAVAQFLLQELLHKQLLTEASEKM